MAMTKDTLQIMMVYKFGDKPEERLMALNMISRDELIKSKGHIVQLIAEGMYEDLKKAFAGVGVEV